MCFFDITILKIGILRIVISVPNPSFFTKLRMFFNGRSGFWGMFE